MMKKLITLALLISVIGCANKTPFDMAQEGPTMKDNYENHLLGKEHTTKNARNVDIERSLENDINYKAVDEYAYRRLQNPELEMFVYPHRSTRLRVIVPGYTVRFPMYEKVQYGLVGDVAYVE